MRRKVARLIVAALAAALAAVAIPADCFAFQTIAIEPNGLEPGEVLVIRGDQVKTSDEITVTLDPTTNEFVITHDVLEPLPPDCHAVGPGPPFKEVRCPAAAIVRVYAYSGSGKDKVVSSIESPGAALGREFLAFLGEESDFFEGGEEDDVVSGEGGGDLVRLGGGDDFGRLGDGTDRGLGGPGRDRLLGGRGGDRLYGGPAFDILNAGLGDDRCFGGAGGAKPIGCEVGVNYGRMPGY